jgi:hypothetical protein
MKNMKRFEYCPQIRFIKNIFGAMTLGIKTFSMKTILSIAALTMMVLNK